MKPNDEGRPFLTRAESEIMKLLWARRSATVHEVIEDLDRPLAYTTVLSVLRLLEQKGYLSHQLSPGGGRAHVYRPIVNQEGARRSHLRDLVDRLFGGQRDELMIGMLRDERWSRAELEKLRDEIEARLLAKKAGQGTNDSKRGSR